MRVGGSNRNGAVDASSAIQPPPGAIVVATPAVPTSHGSSSPSEDEGRAGTILKLPSIPAHDSMLDYVTSRRVGDVEVELIHK
jgi:hypothetical protein